MAQIMTPNTIPRIYSVEVPREGEDLSSNRKSVTKKIRDNGGESLGAMGDGSGFVT